MRHYRSDAPDGASIDPELSTAIETVFFINDEGEVAADVIIDYGVYFDNLEAPDFDIKIHPQHHGHNFEGMFSGVNVIELKDYALEAVILTDGGRGVIAGFVYRDILTNDELLDTLLSYDKDSYKVVYKFNLDPLKADGIEGHTRIVGFRTTKSCESSRQIMSI